MSMIFHSDDDDFNFKQNDFDSLGSSIFGSKMGTWETGSRKDPR
jgi:hypothetical protein